MRQEINIGQAELLSSPNPFVLVSSIKEDGSTNLMALSWWTYVSNSQKLIALATSNKGLTGQNIQAREYFALSMVGEDLGAAAFKCGSCHGFDIDKAAQFDIPLTKEADEPVEYVDGARINLICKLKQVVDLADHNLYIAEVIKAYGDPDVQGVFSWNGYSKPGLVKEA